MTQLAKLNTQSLPMVIATIPPWIQKFKGRKNHTRYKREGMSDMVIPAPPVKLDEKSYNEAKETLDRLLKLSSIPLSVIIVRETFKLVNGMIANMLAEEDFNFKIEAIYSVFQDYPACIFNRETAHKLATINKFFPSGNEIQQVLDKAKSDLDAEIANLKSIIGYGFFTKEDQIQEQIEKQRKQEAIRKQKEEAEYQLRIRRLNNLLKPIDDLNNQIERIVESYVPKNVVEMDQDAIIRHLSQLMQFITDQKIKSILYEKIDALRKAKQTLEQLKRVHIIEVA